VQPKPPNAAIALVRTETAQPGLSHSVGLGGEVVYYYTAAEGEVRAVSTKPGPTGLTASMVKSRKQAEATSTIFGNDLPAASSRESSTHREWIQ
jgi:hypothetical protein